MVSQSTVASLEKLASLAEVSPEPGGPLDSEVSDEHLRDVCVFLVDWGSLAAERLGVSLDEQERAGLGGMRDDGTEFRRKRELVLKTWKAAQARDKDATYRRLGEAFRGLGRADLCLNVFELSRPLAPGEDPVVFTPAEITKQSAAKDIEEVVDWLSLGIQLRIDLDTLELFREDYPRTNTMKKKMVKYWWRKETNPHRADALIDALENSGDKVLAIKLRKKYGVYGPLRVK